MTTHKEEHLNPFFQFLVEFDINYYTIAMAILLDPRFMGGYLFILMTKALYDGDAVNANASAMQLMM